MIEMMSMRKVWIIFGMLAILAISPAMACGHGHGHGGGMYCQNAVITSDELKQKAEDLLKNAVVEERYSYRYDTTHYVLLENGKTVGIIWKSVNLDDLSIGSLIQTNWGVKAEIVYNGEVVGWLFIDGNPTGWQDQGQRQSNGSGLGYGCPWR